MSKPVFRPSISRDDAKAIYNELSKTWCSSEGLENFIDSLRVWLDKQEQKDRQLSLEFEEKEQKERHRQNQLELRELEKTEKQLLERYEQLKREKQGDSY